MNNNRAITIGDRCKGTAQNWEGRPSKKGVSYKSAKFFDEVESLSVDSIKSMATSCRNSAHLTERERSFISHLDISNNPPLKVKASVYKLFKVLEKRVGGSFESKVAGLTVSQLKKMVNVCLKSGRLTSDERRYINSVRVGSRIKFKQKLAISQIYIAVRGPKKNQANKEK